MSGYYSERDGLWPITLLVAIVFTASAGGIWYLGSHGAGDAVTTDTAPPESVTTANGLAQGKEVPAAAAAPAKAVVAPAKPEAQPAVAHVRPRAHGRPHLKMTGFRRAARA